MKYGLLVLGSWILGNLYDRTGVEVIRTPSVDTPCWQASMRRIGWLYRFLSRNPTGVGQTYNLVIPRLFDLTKAICNSIEKLDRQSIHKKHELKLN